jgi:hypothetical protein
MQALQRLTDGDEQSPEGPGRSVTDVTYAVDNNTLSSKIAFRTLPGCGRALDGPSHRRAARRHGMPITGRRFPERDDSGLQAVQKQKPISVHSAARLILKQRCGSPLDMAFILFDKIAN